MLTQPPHEILAKDRNGKETSRRRTALGKREGVSFPTYLGALGKTNSHSLVFIRHSSVAGARNEEHIAAGPS